jgi:hypothetical protein
MPLTVALHCSMVKKPQLVPPALGAYSAHHRVLSQGRAVAGVCVSTVGTITSAAVTLVTKRICNLLVVIGTFIHPSIDGAALAYGPTSKAWTKVKNPKAPAATRIIDETF